jgi:PilZ domain
MAGVVLEVLFVPRRSETMVTIRRAAETMDINLHICTDAQEVERLLFCHRYDGVILDHDENAEQILRALRQSPSSRGAIAIDVHDEEINLQSVFGMGANFELVYPLSVERARRTLHLAMGLMILGRRRYYRHPVELPANIIMDGVQYEACVTNVSEQGIGIRCEETVLKAGPLPCSFWLPDHSATVAISTTVVWADMTGQAGSHIDQFHEGREEYMNWVSRLFHQETTGAMMNTPSSRAADSLPATLGR